MTKQQKNTSDGSDVRPLQAGDLEAVIALDTALSGNSRRGFFEKRLKAALDNPKDYIYVGLYDGGKLNGFAMARMATGEFGKQNPLATLDALGVRLSDQHHGAGRKLLDEVKKILAHKKVSALESQVEWADRNVLGFFASNGFSLAPRIILSRSTDALSPHTDIVEDTLNDSGEIDHSAATSDDFVALSRDRIPVRSMQAGDLDAIIRIDRKHSGRERREYYTRKLDEVLVESGVHVSVVAENDGFPVGFIMARVDFGDFGRTITEAVIDTIGVDPGFQGQGIGEALMSQLVSNLSVLRVENLRTEVAWNDIDTIAFFNKSEFAPTQRIALSCPL